MRRSLESKFRSLGVAFDIAVEPGFVPDPEMTVIESLPDLYADRRMAAAVWAWMISFHDLLSPLRMVKILSAGPMPEENLLRFLGGLARLTRLSSGDRRWRVVELFVFRNMRRDWREESDWMEDFHALRRGKISAFFDFGIVVAARPKIEGDFSRKLLSRGLVIEQNPWIRMRALFGTIPYADAVFFAGLMEGAAVSTIGSLALCSHGTAARALMDCRERTESICDRATALIEKEASSGKRKGEIAKFLGMHRSAVSSIISKRRRIGLRVARRILEKYGINQ